MVLSKTDEKVNSESQPPVDIVFLHINKNTNSRQTWTFLIEKTFLKSKTIIKKEKFYFFEVAVQTETTVAFIESLEQNLLVRGNDVSCFTEKNSSSRMIQLMNKLS